ncbi:hypothetical protein GCK72_002841 [Caenorhabditis remanei]|uniref:Uncharacterized protein n=1 Tax=Caenorhabditis remanei TaxID=31234 RepID=A0A6A5HX51_CAERE|nr:hypothetical protein GCK72_002841 [Caenorhabditis remanei]KAF1771017.1 hypothetical protein GCK72_002841 [Caenorhabditis remanei]
MPSESSSGLPSEFLTLRRFLTSSKSVIQVTTSSVLLLLIHFTVSTKLPKMLQDAGIPDSETNRLQSYLLMNAISCPIIYLLLKKYSPNVIATKRKLIILGLTTIIISVQLLLGAVILKRSVVGFENKPEEYIPCFTALLPLLTVNLMAYALEQPPKIHLVPDGTERTEEMESQF